MPIISGSVSFARFQVERSAKTRGQAKHVSRALSERGFEPLDPKSEDEQAAGFVSLRDRDRAELDADDISVGDSLAFAYRVDKLRVPSSAVKEELKRFARAFEAKNHRRPGRKEQAEEKLLIVRRLRGRAFLSTKTVDVAWNLVADEISIWATGRKLVEEVQGALEETLHLQLRAKTPAVRAAAEGEALGPTPALFGPEVAREVKRHG